MNRKNLYLLMMFAMGNVSGTDDTGAVGNATPKREGSTMTSSRLNAQSPVNASSPAELNKVRDDFISARDYS